MKRYLYNDLKKWQTSAGRKPLVLFGARQVGKTWLLKEFGKNEYKNTAFVSFDRNEAACQLMTSEKDAEKLLRGLAAITGTDITPDESLLILDKIQDCPVALTRLKTFIENNPELTGIRLSMKNHETQPWLENIPLYAFRDYLAQRAKPEM